ncbi:MAG: hypothetical protein LBN99_02205, partial [Oscillospiraceae bacterium]|nr:hypothetical protein [Oscillospiraceae bacterium]
MGKNAMVQCAVCGQEIAKSAAACPHCGAKNKKPIFKKWWFWAVIIVIVGIIGTATQGGDAQQPQTPVATPGTATSTAPSTPTPKPTSTPKPTPAPTPEETVNPNLIDGKFELIGEVTAEKDTFALYITGTLKNTT